MPYYIGDVIKESRRLQARTPEEFAKQGVTVRLNTMVEGIEIDKAQVRLKGGERVPYDVLVVATGTTATAPDIPGTDLEGVFTLKTLTDGITIKRYIEENSCRRGVIVGAGFIAMEMSEAFRLRGMETRVVYRGELPVKKWDQAFSKRVLDEIQRNEVSFLTGRSPLAIEKSDNGALRLITNDGDVEGDIIILALGTKPETALAHDAGIALGKSGALQVNFSQRTNMEEVYSVGDCAEVFHRISKHWVNLPLGDIANRQGRVAGRNIGGYPMIFPGVVGSQCFKIFNLQVAATGLDERDAVRSGYNPESAIIKGSYIARSMSSEAELDLKLIADKSTGRLLGAQAIGAGGAVDRINTLSACLWAEMDLDQIGYMDLAYSPPFGGAWDVIQTAAQILKKKL